MVIIWRTRIGRASLARCDKLSILFHGSIFETNKWRRQGICDIFRILSFNLGAGMVLQTPSLKTTKRGTMFLGGDKTRLLSAMVVLVPI